MSIILTPNLDGYFGDETSTTPDPGSSDEDGESEDAAHRRGTDILLGTASVPLAKVKRLSDIDYRLHVLEHKDKAHKYPLKIVLVGDSNVGKTQFVRAYMDEIDKVLRTPDAIKKQPATIAVDFFKCELLINDIDVVNLQIWDTAGQERFAHLSAEYLRSAHIVLVLYDITELSSFLSVTGRWLPFIEQNSDDPVRILVGNKNDLAHKRAISPHVAVRCGEDNGFLLHTETSALEPCSVHDVINKAVAVGYVIQKRNADGDHQQQQRTNGIVTLGARQDKKKKKKCCH